MTFAPSVRRFLTVLTGIAVLLVAASVLTWVLEHGIGIDHLDFFQEFDLGEENNLPTYFSSTLLFLIAVFLWITGCWSARRRDGNRNYWHLLTAAFLFVSLDESAILHERLTMPMQELGASGWLHFGWVIPAGICVLIFGIVLFPFFLRLERRTRLLFVLSAILYLSGALGVEMMGGRYYEHGSAEAPIYLVLVAVEESLEMAGALLFLYAVLDYLQRHLGEVTVRPSR